MVFDSFKIIFTVSDPKTTRKSIEFYRQSYIINARDLLLQPDYTNNQIINTSQDFIINKELEKKLSQALVNKKSQQVIYFHHIITNEFIKNIKVFFKTNRVRPEYCIFDPNKEYKKIYHLFDSVIN